MCVRVKKKNGRLPESWKPVQKVLEYSIEGSGKRVSNQMEGDGTLWKVLERSRAAETALYENGGKFEIGSAKRDEKRTNEQS